MKCVCVWLRIYCLHPILSASPPATYETPMMPHYILFPSLDHTRKVNLSCAIQPGALKDNYRVIWRRVQPTALSYSDDTFNITVTEMTEMSSTPSEYRCIVTIDHSSMEDEDYTPPRIVVQKRGENSVYSFVLSLHYNTFSLQYCPPWVVRLEMYQ